MKQTTLTSVRWIGLAPVSWMLLACSQLQPVKAPDIPLPDAYKQETAIATAPVSRHEAAPAGKAPDLDQWWKVYGDDRLNRLQQQLLVGSPDLAGALARHEQARAVASSVEASRTPSVGVGLNGQRLRQSERRPLRVLGPSSPDHYNSGTAELDVSYELDLWGRVRARVAAGDAELRASDADLAGARLMLQAQLSDTWLTLIAVDADLALLRAMLTEHEKALVLTTARRQAGIASGLDQERAQGLVETTRSQLSQAQARRSQLENAVAVLVGAHPSLFRLPSSTDLPAMPTIPAGVPSDLLRRRPDIRAAQERVLAASASVGVARTAFFPTLTLGAQGGFQTNDFARFLESPNLFWAIGPSVAATLFDGGLRKAERSRAQAALDEAGARYRSVVLAAFQQVEDQLSSIEQLDRAARQEHAAAASAARALSMALSRYSAGAASYLDVVAAQTAELQARRSELELLSRQRRASVQLIKALGGSWSEPAVAAVVPKAPH